MKPDFLSRAVGKSMTADQRRDWFKVCAREANRQGARWHRFFYDAVSHILLHEGWHRRPLDVAHLNGVNI